MGSRRHIPPNHWRSFGPYAALERIGQTTMKQKSTPIVIIKKSRAINPEPKVLSVMHCEGIPAKVTAKPKKPKEDYMKSWGHYYQ